MLGLTSTVKRKMDGWTKTDGWPGTENQMPVKAGAIKMFC